MHPEQWNTRYFMWMPRRSCGGRVEGKAIGRKKIQVGLWWSVVFKNAKSYTITYDVCQWVENPSRWDDLRLHLDCVLQPFEKWAIDFIVPIIPLVKHAKACYIISTIYYLKKWVEAAPVQNYFVETTARFIYKNIITCFGCTRSLTNDHGMHFMNNTIATFDKGISHTTS